MKEIFSTRQTKNIFITLSIAIFGYILFAVGISIYSIFETPNKILTIFIISAKDFVQILFFITVAAVGVLSYFRAKETLFTPIKTETFKMQIKFFEEILLFFQNKHETELTKKFDFDKILHVNSHLMMNDYISCFFKNEIEIDKEMVKEQMNDFAGAIVSQSFMEEHFISPEYHKKTKKDEIEEITNPALILSKWRKYDYGKIEYTYKYHEELEKLQNLSASPLIPSELKIKLDEFQKVIHENLLLIGKVLTIISQELPDKFPNTESIKKFESSGIWNRYNKDTEELEVKASEIIDFIKEYLKIEELIK
jgi:hypothetical protein